MTADERKEYQQKRQDDEVTELKRKVARMEMASVASKLLREAEIDVTDEILEFVVADDAETTAENIKKFVGIKGSLVKDVEKSKYKGKHPKVLTNSNSGKKVTKADFAKLSYKEVLALKKKDPEGYKKLMED